MEDNISTSAGTIRSLPPMPTFSLSQPSSPRSSALPSPPDSPNGSISSLPSVSSSFFFSSAAASPGPHSHPHSDHAHEHAGTHALIIPSLTLPPALRRPTPFGKTLGDVRLIVLGPEGDDTERMVEEMLLEDNEDVVEHSPWDRAQHQGQGTSVLRASTDWIEHTDPHGLDKFEPAHNVEIVRVLPCDRARDIPAVLETTLSIIHEPFRALSALVDPACPPSGPLAGLLASPASPLHTALLFLPGAGGLSPGDDSLLDALAPHVPIICLPPASGSSAPSTSATKPARAPKHQHAHAHAHLSAFQPRSARALRTGIFRAPETIAGLRYEAAERFLRWRDVEGAVRAIGAAKRARRLSSVRVPSAWDVDESDAHEGAGAGGAGDLGLESGLGPGSGAGSGAGAGSAVIRARKRRSLPVGAGTGKGRAGGGKTWDKARWEAEWGERLSADVARRLREEEEDNSKTAEAEARDQSDHNGAGTGAVNKAPSASESPRTHRSRRLSTHSNYTSSSQRPPAQRPARRRRLSSLQVHTDPTKNPSSSAPQVDPLHLPSLLLMSLSLLRPMQARLVRAVVAFSGRVARDGCVHVALLGGFCVGVGVGVVVGGVVSAGAGGGEW
ncbi:hypothetical protein CONPUDRAFT_166348 [Coniophora puteana RWD-64-598 SS2]|uniref:Septin-type G domain-containing protein n=1 Tax=Coniophora puteana (strain RWD-64-598) TaxID=741705 RepID=A0A5M3MKV0_CONPW|nr:uncharacterized protein CONPUDRAFT_166348 [Coniophora puteana RWD-64-598 SS2]EIW79600.1 hypothetical protein CONPUDRAFT_166348 [Coniophora puteana RWD-64-598 SS2]